MDSPSLRLVTGFLTSLTLTLAGCLDRSTPAPAPGEDEPAADTFGSFLPDGAPEFAAPSSATDRPAVSAPDRPEDFARWERNPVRAYRKAQALDRPLLLLFTGLEWSENARLLGEEVFLSRSFNAFAREHLALAFMDFPQNPSDAPDVLQALKEKYRVRGFPTVVLINAEGNELHRQTGYVPGKARDYFREIHLAVTGHPPESLPPPSPDIANPGLTPPIPSS